MPPVGQIFICGRGLANDLIKLVPPAALAGKNFIAVNPASSKCIISETVLAPGSNGRSAALQPSITACVVPGDTAKCAPASLAAWASLAEITVPAPMQIFGRASAIALIVSKAAGVRSVISIVFNPPANNASASATLCLASLITITGITGPIAKISVIGVACIAIILSPKELCPHRPRQWRRVGAC